MGDLTPDTAAELRRIRAEIAILRGYHQHTATLIAQTRMRHSWAKHVVRDLETNPRTQYKVHLWGVCYWLLNFPLVAFLFFGFPAAWLKLGVFITLIYSIYANLATDYGAMSAAMAAYGSAPLPEIPGQEYMERPESDGD